MKILYLARFIKAHNCEQYAQYGLEQCGATVRSVEVTGSSLRQVNGVINSFEPDVVLFSKADPGYAKELLWLCEKLNILTVTWLWDLYWGFRITKPGQLHPTTWHANLLFTTDGGHQHEWERYGYNHRVLRQGIHQPHAFQSKRNYKYDVAFVGGVGHNYHPSRNQLVEVLRREYAGRFIHHTDTRGPDLNVALGEVKIVVGDSYPSPRYWSNRVYEIIGRGGFLLHPNVEGLEEEFDSGEHRGGYERGDYEALFHTMQYYLGNESKREMIRQQGFDRCSQQYTYTHRAAELLRHIQEARECEPL